MHTALGEDVVATLHVVGPPPVYGARIEVPITREIVSMWQPGVLAGDVWTVTLQSPVTGGDYILAWVPQDPLDPEHFEPLFVEG